MMGKISSRSAAINGVAGAVIGLLYLGFALATLRVGRIGGMSTFEIWLIASNSCLVLPSALISIFHPRVGGGALLLCSFLFATLFTIDCMRHPGTPILIAVVLATLPFIFGFLTLTLHHMKFKK